MFNQNYREALIEVADILVPGVSFEQVIRPRFPRWLPPVGDDGSTMGVRTTLPVMNRRGRS